MKLEDALFNWLQIKIVAEARPDDQAAQETVDFFATILIEDHQLEKLPNVQTDERMVQLQYTINGTTKHQKFEREFVELLLHDINANPKYNE